VLLDELNQTFATKEPLRIGAGSGAEVRFHGLIDEVRVYGRVLSPDEAGALSVVEPLSALAVLPVSQRKPQQNAKLRLAFLDEHAPDAMRGANRQLLSWRSERAKLVESLPTTMVMEELPRPRDTFVLKRGEYDKRGDKVEPGVPAVFPPLPSGAPRKRLILVSDEFIGTIQKDAAMAIATGCLRRDCHEVQGRSIPLVESLELAVTALDFQFLNRPAGSSL